MSHRGVLENRRNRVRHDSRDGEDLEVLKSPFGPSGRVSVTMTRLIGALRVGPRRRRETACVAITRSPRRRGFKRSQAATIVPAVSIMSSIKTQ